MTTARANAVIRFEPDGYDIRRPWLMGRQVAGHGFLRAAVQGRGEAPVYGYTGAESSAEAFKALVQEIDPAADARWIKSRDLDGLSNAGAVLYLADPALNGFARMRLRAGPGRFSLCGVTHTTATAGTMAMIADLLTAPVAPWDALICTSAAVLETVRLIHEAQADYLRWKLGPQLRLALPQLPVIPLGVHCADFQFGEAETAQAREALGIGPDDVVALFVGRLTFTGKAHPFPIFHGLQAAAERSGKRVVLLQCGWSPNEEIAQAYVSGAAAFAPLVRTLTVDGREARARRQAWAAADLFVSMSDGIQETFGLTPLEAMAAGLPCVVSDWNGYRETVRDGVDGFRIPTWAPGPGGFGAEAAAHLESGLMTYDAYCWAAASATSVDLGELAERLTALIEQPELRRKMGDAGRARAQQAFDWAVVFAQYQDLWAELNARRLALTDSPEELAWAQAAPKASAAAQDPFHIFAHYPTGRIEPAVRVALEPGADMAAFRALAGHVLFTSLQASEANTAPIVARLERGPASVSELAAAGRLGVNTTAVIVGTLAKMGLVKVLGA